MKKNLIFALLAAGSLFSCQQQDEQLESSKEAINFTMSIDDALVGSLTRANNNFNPVKRNFVTGDVISLAASGQSYAPFVIGKDSRNWSSFSSSSDKTVKFYALYPALDASTTTRALATERTVEGGDEYLFGTAEATPGIQNVALKFTRMTIPVVVLDENGKPYTGNAQIRLNLKNQGTQDLTSGIITVNESAPAETIEVKTLSEGTITNVLPQTIEAGEEVGTVTIDGQTQTLTSTQDIDLVIGTQLSLRVSKSVSIIGGGIIDGNVPLFY